MSAIRSWSVAGPYFEACSCEAICPCRSTGGRKGGRSTYGVCDFALGRAGGTTLRNFAHHIGDVRAVRPARIAIDHTRSRHWLHADEWVEIVEREPVISDEPVTCAIPGHDRSGEEVIADLLALREEDLSIEVRGRCGYVATYDYRSDD